MGSGTTAIASRNLRRDFIGCETNKRYYKLCIENIALYPTIDAKPRMHVRK